jgi:WD40 repeat protein
MVLAFAPNGRLLVCSGPKFALSVLDAKTLKVVVRFAGHTAAVSAAVFSPDSTQILSAGRDQVVRLWNARSGAPIRELTGHWDVVNSVAFSPDGRVAYSAGGNSDFEREGHDDFAVRQWNLDTGQCLAKFTGHQARVRAIALNSDGSILLSASDDKTLKLWETKSGKEVFAITGHISPVIAARFVDDGRAILSAGEDHSLFLWDIGSPRRRADLLNCAGDRYAYLGRDSWAADRLLADQTESKTFSHLTLARCLWKLGQADQAIVEMKAARDGGEVPMDYLSLCIQTLQNLRK